ncbi:hypothetical protein [Fodinibius sediminis]|uniref:Uncharacterized protein n=1 Tax=Fodinibius sediminis TaxID=1214077 RepID=A0A521C9P2_9BACT|nr:hypothetical protein [Fodinibius sediminis]SMO56192.1 hypothetical protein SAMN06265218_105182 [Fodinibius sediminis]
MNKYTSRPQNLYLETQLGIVTRTGDWFHTTSDHIEQFVPGLLKERSLDHLVEEAVAWVRSADSLALTLLLVLLIYIHPVFAAVIAITFHFFWYRFKSGFVTIYMGKLLKMMNKDGYLLITSLVIISLVGMNGQYLAAGVGLVFFFLMKLGLLKRLWDKIDEDKAGELSLNDRVFKMILLKYAMHFNKAPSEVQSMEKKFKELALNRKQGTS